MKWKTPTLPLNREGRLCPINCLPQHQSGHLVPARHTNTQEFEGTAPWSTKVLSGQ